MKRDELRSKLLTLTKGQLFWIGKVIDYYSRPYQSRFFLMVMRFLIILVVYVLNN